MAMSFNMLSTTSASKKLVRKGVSSPDDNKSLYSLVIYYVTNTHLLSFNNLLITPLKCKQLSTLRFSFIFLHYEA